MRQTDEAQVQREEKGRGAKGRVCKGWRGGHSGDGEGRICSVSTWLPVNQRPVLKSLWNLMDLIGSLDLQGRAWGCSLRSENAPSMAVLACAPGLVFHRQS